MYKYVLETIVYKLNKQKNFFYVNKMHLFLNEIVWSLIVNLSTVLLVWLGKEREKFQGWTDGKIYFLYGFETNSKPDWKIMYHIVFYPVFYKYKNVQS